MEALGELDFASLMQATNVDVLLEAVNPNLPADFASFPAPGPVPSHLDPSEVLTFNYDEGHAGRFTVFGTGGASVSPQTVLGRDDPFGYLRDADDFVYGEAGTPDELIIFSPGLNTLHEPDMETEARTSPMRVAHYANILGFGMAQVHTGTQMDQDPFVINPVPAELEDFLFDNDLLLYDNSIANRQERFTYEVQPEDKDKVQCVASSRNLLDTQLKRTVRALIDIAVRRVVLEPDEPTPHLVLMVYSRATVETGAAIRLWIDGAMAEGTSREDAEKVLRSALTVVTIGAADSNFPDGPAYVHVSTWEDQLTAKVGVNAKKTQGGGADAVYLTTTSPYSTAANDGHNAGAVIMQYLACVMKLNGLVGLRQLYDVASDGNLVMPPDGEMFELVTAMIVATKGYEWLWFPDVAFDGVPPLPEEDEARQILDAAFGNGTYDEIAKINEGGMQAIMDDFTKYEVQSEGKEEESKEDADEVGLLASDTSSENKEEESDEGAVNTMARDASSATTRIASFSNLIFVLHLLWV